MKKALKGQRSPKKILKIKKNPKKKKNPKPKKTIRRKLGSFSDRCK